MKLAIPGVLRRPAAAEGHALSRGWRTGMIAGFVVLLLLILFVATIGFREMQASQERLQRFTEQHMQKLVLTKTMHMSARNRVLGLHKMTLMEDPFARDEEFLAFNRYAAEFVKARQELLAMKMAEPERALLDEQGRLTAIALPIQQQVVDLVYRDRLAEAQQLLLEQAISQQDAVLEVLTKLDERIRTDSLKAVSLANHDYQRAQLLMLVLSASAILAGLLVATVVFRHAHYAGQVTEHLAMHDALTGLPNRLLLADRLEQAIAYARRDRHLVGVMFVDLDNFKLVNDSLGHAAGDLLITAVAERIQGTVRALDTVARVGGDEFVVIVGGPDRVDDLIQIAENLISSLKQPFLIAERVMYASCSVGLSVYPMDGETPQLLLQNADIAMYHAKQAGRGHHQLYDEAMNRQATRRLELETAMREGVGRDEFIMYYQPQVDWNSGRVCGVEALVRWHHPQKGLLLPGEFLELAEKSELILQIGRRGLHQACLQHRRWQAADTAEIKVAFNLSGREFWHADLFRVLSETLERTGLPPENLQLELTERILMTNVEQAAQRIRDLKAMGVMIALDDFGTGYSSLAHLKRFAIDVLKIDRYFVKDIEELSADRAIVRAILALAGSLGMEVVAEGVERVSQIELLQELGCSKFQGFLISEPLAPQGLKDWIAQRQRGCLPAQPDTVIA